MSIRDRVSTLRWFSFAILATFLGCGYSTDRTVIYRTKNANNDRIRTVAVDVFQTKEFRRGLETQLTEALAKRIETETPFKLAKKNVADSLITGEILEVRQSTIGRDFQHNRPRETTLTLVISFRWKDLRTGETLVERPSFLQTVDYVRPLGEDFYHGSQKAVDLLAERIIREGLQSTDW